MLHVTIENTKQDTIVTRMRHFIACCVLIAVLSSVSAYTCPPTLKSGLMELFDEMNGVSPLIHTNTGDMDQLVELAHW